MGDSQQHAAAFAEVECCVHRHHDSDGHHDQRQQSHEDGSAGVVAAPVLVAVTRDACHSTRVFSLAVAADTAMLNPNPPSLPCHEI